MGIGDRLRKQRAQAQEDNAAKERARARSAAKYWEDKEKKLVASLPEEILRECERALKDKHAYATIGLRHRVSDTDMARSVISKVSGDASIRKEGLTLSLDEYEGRDEGDSLTTFYDLTIRW